MKKKLGPIAAGVIMLILAIAWIWAVRSVDYSKMLGSGASRQDAPAAQSADGEKR